MATFAELETFVAGALIDTPPFVQSEIPALINEAMHELQSLHNFDVMRAVATWTTQDDADRNLGFRPLDWKAWRGRPFFLDVNGAAHAMVHANSREEVIRNGGFSASGRPYALVINEPNPVTGEIKMDVYPYSDSLSDYPDGEYRVVAPYWAYTTALAEDADANWFTDNLTTAAFVKYRAVSFGFELNEDHPKADRWNARAQDKAKLAISTDKRGVVSGTDTVVMHTGALQPNIAW